MSQADMAAAGVSPGRRLVFVLDYTGGGTRGQVDHTQDGIVFLTDGRRLRWAAVLWIQDDDR